MKLPHQDAYCMHGFVPINIRRYCPSSWKPLFTTRNSTRPCEGGISGLKDLLSCAREANS